MRHLRPDTYESFEQSRASRWAESEEGRPLIKENIHQSSTRPTQSGSCVSQGLAGVRKAAREHKEMKFTALLHHVTIDLLKEQLRFSETQGCTRRGWDDVAGV